MTHRDFSSDPKALLENVDGSLLTLLKEKLIESRNWEKLARICENYEGKRVFSQTDINRMAHKPSPEEAFIEELLKRNVTVEYIICILKRAEMFDLLVIIGKEERAEIVNQSVTGLKEVKLDEEVKLTMNVTGIPLPSFQWYKGEDPIPESTSATHCINAFDVKDEGIYLCLVRQFLKEGDYLFWSSPIHLCIKEDSPSFLHGPERVVDIQEGQELLIKCAFDGYPWPTYSWVRDGEILTSGEVEPVFKIENTRLSDTGVYKCVARNYLGEAESNPVSVEVKPKGKSSNVPQIICHPFLCEEKPERTIGQSLILVCSARCAQNIMFTWVVNGKSLKGTQSSRYTIMSSMSPPDYNSSLVYTVGEDNGTTLKVLCVVKSADSSQFSDEVKVKIVSKDSSSIEYFAGSKWALLIANTDYNIDPLPPLFTPASDMEKLAKELSEMNFHCLMLTNLNLIELKNSVKFFSSLIKPGDYAVFCYAGHGLFSGVDFLMPVPDHNSTTELETLSSVWVRSVLQKNDPALLFIVLDMCRHIHNAPINGNESIVKGPAKRNCVILNATTEGYQSLEDPKKSSVLTSSLVKHLKDKVDLVSMAKAILRDVAHMSPYVRSEQIPKLDVNLCDNRSLTDPQKLIDGQKELIWSKLVELPHDRKTKVNVDGKDIWLLVHCFPGGDFQLMSNVFMIELQVQCEGTPPAMSLAFNVKNNIKPVVRKYKSVVYEVKSIHKIKDPIVISIAFRSQSNEIVKEEFVLGLPGISKIKLYDTVCEATLRTTTSTYNIP